jgi:Tfp pilus assembly protein PilZ
LSTGGVFIETSNLLPVDTPLTIRFILPENETSVRCEGRVAWLNHPELIRNPNLPVGMGLQFINISLDDMNVIRQFMKNEGLLPFW